MTDFCDRLEAVYTGALHDVMRAMGLTNFVLPPEILPLANGDKLAGPIYTVEGKSGTDLDAHETLLEWTGLLSKAPSGHVIICQPNTHEVALMGELSAETLKFKGIRGYIVDGGSRDVEFLLNMEFSTWCSFKTPKDIVGRWLPVSFNETIRIGDVDVSGGDWVLADLDGIVILPKDKAEEIVAETERVIGTENKIRSAIFEGMDPQDAYLKWGKF
ncbi:MAG: RraA family protein [Rhodospirillales bacterium]|jgi:4-hydroxy-4-methyl-2-oxoglutarate aldolase|tara:strand:+ start:340 stop:987 length:648 start_codon:yes stop_codon:yes gene_type:complete